MAIRFWHWLGAFFLATVIHLGAVWWLHAPSPEPPADTPKRMRMAITNPQSVQRQALQASSQAPTTEASAVEPEPVQTEAVEQEVTESARPMETKAQQPSPAASAQAAKPAETVPTTKPPDKEVQASQTAPSQPTRNRKEMAEDRPVSAPGGMSNRQRKAYAHRVLAWLQRYKEYPQRARFQHLEGRVVLRLRVAADGEVRSVAVAESSGHRVLDRAAKTMVKRASPLPAPEDLGSGDVELKAPVSYRLD